ncbi:MAG TPA: TOBE domain-containing protein, partial [Micromonosporaceae bacterium]|nr:TOBE domain-containing protein [Micromonosporaceae bacterium]
ADGAGAPATVERVEVVGEDAYVYLRAGEHGLAARVRAADRPAPGDPVWVSARPDDVHHFDAATGRRIEPA